MNNTPILEVKDLHVEFASRRKKDTAITALRGVSLSVSPGEILGIVGESGAGKSLTGAAITGLLEPSGSISRGEIWFDGRRIDDLTEAERGHLRGRRIGTIFQDPLTSLNPLMSIGDQLIETIQTHLNTTAAEARRHAVELLESVGVPAASERLQHYPFQFSGGMRQRVVIALAIAAGPELLIADEPTTALDVSVQAQVLDLLRRLCREKGMAMMLVTHDMGVIAETADRVAVMYAGLVVETGKVEDVLHNPSHPYTSGLMGSIPTIGAADSRQLAQIRGAMPRPGSVPPGCPFQPRCDRSQNICHAERPPLIDTERTHTACFFPVNAGGFKQNTFSAFSNTISG